jgi:hypothetical protein
MTSNINALFGGAPGCSGLSRQLRRFSPSGLVFLIPLLISSVASAWELSATAGDTTGATVRDAAQSLPGTPASASIRTADLLPDAYAQVDVPAGELRVLAFDPLGDNSNPLVQASANVVRFFLKNNTTNTYNVPGGILGMAVSGEHLLSGAPTNVGAGTGTKTAKISYTSQFQWRNFSQGTVIGTSVLVNNLVGTWDEDGVFQGAAFETPTAVGDAGTVLFNETDYLAALSIPGFSWAPDVVMEFKAEISIGASASDPGLAAWLNATNTAKLSFVLPEGIDPEDAGLLTREDLPWITTTVVPVPTALWLFVSAIGLLAGLRRKRMN